jgi:hypothetical protein
MCINKRIHYDCDHFWHKPLMCNETGGCGVWTRSKGKDIKDKVCPSCERGERKEQMALQEHWHNNGTKLLLNKLRNRFYAVIQRTNEIIGNPP